MSETITHSHVKALQAHVNLFDQRSYVERIKTFPDMSTSVEVRNAMDVQTKFDGSLRNGTILIALNYLSGPDTYELNSYNIEKTAEQGGIQRIIADQERPTYYLIEGGKVMTASLEGKRIEAILNQTLSDLQEWKTLQTAGNIGSFREWKTAKIKKLFAEHNATGLIEA